MSAATPAPAGVPPGRADSDLEHPLITDLTAIQWVTGPDALPPGAQMSLLEGLPAFPPGKTFTFAVKLPANYVIPPHVHPSAERITVLQGQLMFGHGPKLDPQHATAVTTGGLITVPAGHPHFAFTSTAETVIVLHGIGPWNIYYLDPSHDPRQPPPKRPEIRPSPLETAVVPRIFQANQVAFSAPPAGMMPPGIQIAMLEGDPRTPNKTFVMRVKLPDGFRLPVHSQGITDRFDVVQGELRLGIGRTFDEDATIALPVGSIVILPRGLEHFGLAHGETVIQIMGVGPYKTTWTHAADEPAVQPPTPST